MRTHQVFNGHLPFRTFAGNHHHHHHQHHQVSLHQLLITQTAPSVSLTSALHPTDAIDCDRCSLAHSFIRLFAYFSTGSVWPSEKLIKSHALILSHSQSHAHLAHPAKHGWSTVRLWVSISCLPNRLSNRSPKEAMVDRSRSPLWHRGQGSQAWAGMSISISLPRRMLLTGANKNFSISATSNQRATFSHRSLYTSWWHLQDEQQSGGREGNNFPPVLLIKECNCLFSFCFLLFLCLVMGTCNGYWAVSVVIDALRLRKSLCLLILWASGQAAFDHPPYSIENWALNIEHWVFNMQSCKLDVQSPVLSIQYRYV